MRRMALGLGPEVYLAFRAKESKKHRARKKSTHAMDNDAWQP
jgi:hypothetical protein